MGGRGRRHAAAVYKGVDHAGICRRSWPAQPDWDCLRRNGPSAVPRAIAKRGTRIAPYWHTRPKVSQCRRRAARTSSSLMSSNGGRERMSLTIGVASTG